MNYQCSNCGTKWDGDPQTGGQSTRRMLYTSGGRWVCCDCPTVEPVGAARIVSAYDRVCGVYSELKKAADDLGCSGAPRDMAERIGSILKTYRCDFDDLREEV